MLRGWNVERNRISYPCKILLCPMIFKSVRRASHISRMSSLDLEKIEGPLKQLFGLPAVVRVRIYESFDSHTTFTSLSDGLIRHNIQPAILRTCQTINHEASDVLNSKNIFINIVHKSSVLERNLSVGGVSLLSKKAPCNAFWHLSLEMRIITTNLPLSNKVQHLIVFEDLPTVCKLLWVTPVILRTDYFSLKLKLSESICGIALSTKTKESLSKNIGKQQE